MAMDLSSGASPSEVLELIFTKLANGSGQEVVLNAEHVLRGKSMSLRGQTFYLPEQI